MMVNKRLIKKSVIYFIGNLSSKIMSSLLIPIYAFCVNIDDLGYYDFSQTVMRILCPIIILAIWEAVLKFILSEDDVIIKRKIMTTSAFFSLTMSLLFAIGVTIFSFVYTGVIRYIVLITAMIILHTIVYVWQYYARASGNNKLFVVAGIASTIINFIFVLLLVVLLKMGLLGLLLAYNLGQVSIIFIIEKKLGIMKNLKFSDFEFSILKKMLKFSSPLVLNLISAWFMSGFGRVIIMIKLGTEANGIYSFANKFSMIITMIGSVITMAIIEEAILSIKTKGIDQDFNKTIESLFMIFQTIALLAVPAIVVFYAIIAETDYYRSVFFAPWLLIYSVSNTMASNIGSIFQAIDKTKYQFITTLLGGIMTVLVSLIFIEKIGISAVIIGQILGAITMIISRYILINKFITIKIHWKPVILMSILFLIITLVSLTTNFLISIGIEVILMVTIIYLNRIIIKRGLIKLKTMVVKK